MAELKTSKPRLAKELQSRLVIGIVTAVKSSWGKTADNITDLHLIKTELASLWPTLEPAYVYRSSGVKGCVWGGSNNGGVGPFHCVLWQVVG